ncbi:hypothetical protein DACRYDRAFT_99599 [Dacryopinax primogenitus]|uniref:DDHD domain-containing protein n=1 Tax=Dacryopinax primogenitus (strain DJM 731) TaxID=1858805 RepID=M5GBA3_DACPD|nr:uncharacterized protein DACRYDRAFT_99599 [Dacryopinax primogenitus]EJU03322.1 hypothetical protein DACRYDRAFT_99599 [Dacryopinax primogenitus]
MSDIEGDRIPTPTLWETGQLGSPTEPPPIVVRWIHLGSSHIALPDSPVSSPTTSWDALTVEESRLCEEAWNGLPAEERAAIDKEEREKETKKDSGKDKDKGKNKTAGAEPPTLDRPRGIPVGRDGLFEVDIKTLTLFSVFWRLSTPPILVRRATWMYNTHQPCEYALCDGLEEAYRTIKPYLSSYAAELKTSISLGSEAQAKLRYRLPSGQVVLFQTSTSAYIYPAALARALPALTAMFSMPPGTSVVHRGYDAAERATKTNHSRTSSRAQSGSLEDQAAMETLGQAVPEAGDEEKEGSDKVTDLILVIHGIGQGLAASWEAFNFVYAVNIIRGVARKQALSPALSSVLRSHRVQFLPILWRANIQIDEAEEEARKKDGLDNAFTVEDITIKGSIPYVRDMTNNVLIDIPYFMSDHRYSMVDAVCAQANRAYRLWCERHPDFLEFGRVHIVAHSLGAALAAHILSDQPTYTKQYEFGDPIPKNHFIFDTSTLFMLGSPLGILMNVYQSQLIARRGRERTKDAEPDVALDKVGKFGCLAVDAIYNIFNAPDPVAYLVNPCVDADVGRTRPPSAVPNIIGGIMDGVTNSLSRFKDSLPTLPTFPPLPTFPTLPSLNSFAIPFSVWISSAAAAAEAEKKEREPAGAQSISAIDMAPSPEVIAQRRKERAEKRFKALNPHGTLDYVLPRQSNMSEYLEMISAHATYWADPNLSSFILTEISASKEDLVRTGLSIDEPVPVPVEGTGTGEEGEEIPL